MTRAMSFLPDIFLKDQLLIYNNQAHFGKIQGRLSVSYEFFPSPAIYWEFEVFDQKDAALENNDKGELAHPFIGNQISIPRPVPGSSRKFDTPRHTRGFVRDGQAPIVLTGNEALLGNSFRFWLPNTKFHSVALYHGSVSKKVSRESNNPLGVQLPFSSEMEGYLEAVVSSDLNVKLHTPIESLNWLKSNRSTGSYLTTSGTLRTSHKISISDAVKVLEGISDLLSFANGGFIAPLIVAMAPIEFERDYPIQFSAYVIDSIENLGESWLGWDSDLSALLTCLPAYQNMLRSPSWGDDFSLILIWYFQAIQHQGLQRNGKPWPVAANALGAALEKLASIILVDEMNVLSKTKFKDASLEKRIRTLLKTIGISDSAVKYGTENPNQEAKDAISWFVEMRNDATHPKSSRKWTRDEISVTFWHAVQWVEEILLWRLGYQGKYRNRAGNQMTCIPPRYDLSRRDASW